MGTFADQIKNQFRNRKVGVVEFSESDEFCNKPLYPRQQVLLKLIFLEEMEGWEEDILSEWAGEKGYSEVSMSPRIRERRDWLRSNNYAHFPEIVLVGGRRSSKGFITSLAVGKKMYETFKLGDPGKAYGIDPDKEIYFSCVAASLDQAKQYQYADLVSVISRCKAFGEGIKILEESFTIPTSADQAYLLEMKNRGIKIGRDFSKLRCKPLAANADTLRGSATMATIFDEMAFMMEGESRSSAAQCYAALKPSLDQFGKDALVFLNSSPYTKIGKFFDRWDDSMNDGSDKDAQFYPALMSMQFPSWELYRGWETAPKIVVQGVGALMVSPDQDPEKLTESERLKCIAAKDEESANPETFKVERRGQWAVIEDAYLNEGKVDEAFAPIWNNIHILSNRTSSSYYHRYKGHCDPSSTTAGFGFAMAHVEHDQAHPHVVFDYIKRWNPRDYSSGTIEWESVIEEITYYIDIFRPEEFSFDQFNSAAPIQTLRQVLNDKRIGGTQIKQVTATAKLNWNRWETFKAALNRGLVHIPADCEDSWWASEELKRLQIKNGRVDHQDMGIVKTKDIADCIAECTAYLLNTEHGFRANPLNEPPAYGAEGGFGIGKRQDSLNTLGEIARSRQRDTILNPASGMAHRMRRRY